MLRFIKFGFLLCILLSTPGQALAQGPAPYRTQLVRIIVPVSPGSIADTFARMIAEKLAELWKQQVIVENRPGLSGVAAAAKSPADGHTLLLNSNGHTIAGAINKNLQFDPVRDFAGVSIIASVPLVMIVPPNLHVKNVADLTTLAREKPGQLNIANAGVSTTSFLSAEIFKQNARIDIVHVPYRGAPEAVTAVMRGDAHMYFAPIPAAKELGETGKVTAIAINSGNRAPQLPQMPTIAESGLADFKYESWFGLLAPAGTPRPVLEKISRDTAALLRSTELRDRIQQLGAIPVTNTPEQFDAIIRSDTDRNAKIISDAGIAPK